MATFLLLHGIPGCAATWTHLRETLAPDHRVIAPDLVGFGAHVANVDGDELLAPAQARHVLDRLDSADVERVVLVGHDFGGPVAAHLIAIAPERFDALGLFATNVFPDTRIPFPLSLVTAPMIGTAAARMLFSRRSLTMMIRRGVGDPGIALQPEQLIGGAEQHRAIASIFANSLRRLTELYTPIRDTLASVTVPTLIGWGERDPFFPVAVGERTAELIPGARLRVYAGAGHFLPDERPVLIAADLAELAETASHR